MFLFLFYQLYKYIDYEIIIQSNTFTYLITIKLISYTLLLAQSFYILNTYFIKIATTYECSLTLKMF